MRLNQLIEAIGTLRVPNRYAESTYIGTLRVPIGTLRVPIEGIFTPSIGTLSVPILYLP
jgi:hypothetical protein